MATKLVGYTEHEWVWREGMSLPIPEEFKLRKVFVEEAPPLTTALLPEAPGYTDADWARMGLPGPVPDHMKYRSGCHQKSAEILTFKK